MIPKTINGNDVITIEISVDQFNKLTSVIPNVVKVIYGDLFSNNNIAEVTISDIVEILTCDALDSDTIINKSASLACNDRCSYKDCPI